MAGPEDFLSPTFNATDDYDFAIGSTDYSRKVAFYAQRLRDGINGGHYSRLEVQDCSKSYRQQYVTRWGDLLLIQEGGKITGNRTLGLFNIPQEDKNGSYTTSVNDGQDISISSEYSLDASNLKPNHHIFSSNSTWIISNYTGTLHALPEFSDPRAIPSYDWQCFGLSDSQHFCNGTTLHHSLQPGGQWKPFGRAVKHCWAERTEERCSLTFNVGIGLAVICCNLVKACCMFFTLIWVRRPGLMTLGDAIQSFINCHDPHTAGLCTFSAARMDVFWNADKCAVAWPAFFGETWGLKALDDIQQPWTPQVVRWWRAVTPIRYHCYLL